MGIPFHLKDYIELVDITGRAIREDKRGYIDQQHPPILERLDIDSRQWLSLTTQFESRFKSLAGARHSILRAAKKLAYQRLPAKNGYLDAFS